METAYDYHVQLQNLQFMAVANSPKLNHKRSWTSSQPPRELDLSSSHSKDYSTVEKEFQNQMTIFLFR